MENWPPQREQSRIRKWLLWGICIGITLTLSIALSIHFLNKDITTTRSGTCVNIGFNINCNIRNGGSDLTPVSTNDNSDNTNVGITQSTIPYHPGRGILVMDDGLQGNQNGYNWDSGVTRGGTCTFENKAYDDDAREGLLNSCVAQSKDMTNFAFEIHMKLTSASSAGVAFGVNRDSGALYYFAIDKNGNYVLQMRTAQTSDFMILTRGAVPVRNGDDIVIAITVQDKIIRAYVNHTQVLSLKSGHYSHGLIGVISYGGMAAFNSARAWSV